MHLAGEVLTPIEAQAATWVADQLLEALREVPDLDLGVATAYPGLPDLQFDEDGVEYFVVGQGRFTSHFGARRSDLLACRDVVERFDPERAVKFETFAVPRIPERSCDSVPPSGATRTPGAAPATSACLSWSWKFCRK